MAKTVVVTGGSKGIGRAICSLFLSKGYTVITCARSKEDLEKCNSEWKQQFGGEFHFCVADLSKKEEVMSFAAFVRSKIEKIDVLVNNTGVFLPGQISTEEEGVFEQMMHTNLFSAYYLTRQLLPLLVQNGEGDIYNICSTASIMPYSNGGSYCISKYALYGMTKVLREELKEKNIKVTAVLPGATFTSSWDGVDLPQSRFVKPEDVAESIWSAHSLSANAVVEELLIRPQLGDL